MMPPALHPHGALPANLIAFCHLLRSEHGFTIGPGEAADAALAVEYVGIADLARVREALRLVLCASREQAAVFDGAFDAFFLPDAPRGILQRNLHPRHTRPHQPLPPQASTRAAETPDRLTSADEETDAQMDSRTRRQIPVAEDADDQAALRVQRARYSAAPGESAPPDVPREGLDAMLTAAGLLVRRLQLGRSRRWRAMPVGPRFDFRRTMRSSLQTGGEALKPRWQGHPWRNPRIVVVVDGSRSMSDSAAHLLQFAYALSQRTSYLRAFIFSTELRDVTMQLRRSEWGQLPRLTGLAEAWGGGTRIGECLERLIHEFGHRCLSEHTAVIILSDGLDVGDLDRLRRAMRELQRRTAGVIWLNPLLDTPGYTPSAQGMSAALPYISVFRAAGDAQALQAMARTLTL